MRAVMSRALTLVVVAIVVIGAFIMLRSHHDITRSAQDGFNTQEITAQSNPNFQNWREFVSASGHFKVMLPSLPQHVSDKIVDPQTKELRKYETFITVGDNGEAFMVSSITFSRNIEEEIGGESLKAIINDMLLRNKINKLNSMNPSVHHSFYAFEFSITSGDLLISGKIFAKGNTVYLISMINKSDSFDEKELNFFLNSFDINNDKTKTKAKVG